VYLFVASAAILVGGLLRACDVSAVARGTAGANGLGLAALWAGLLAAGPTLPGPLAGLLYAGVELGAFLLLIQFWTLAAEFLRTAPVQRWRALFGCLGLFGGAAAGGLGWRLGEVDPRLLLVPAFAAMVPVAGLLSVDRLPSERRPRLIPPAPRRAAGPVRRAPVWPAVALAALTLLLTARLPLAVLVLAGFAWALAFAWLCRAVRVPAQREGRPPVVRIPVERPATVADAVARMRSGAGYSSAALPDAVERPLPSRRTVTPGPSMW
jgi:hypothetical protein